MRRLLFVIFWLLAVSFRISSQAEGNIEVISVENVDRLVEIWRSGVPGAVATFSPDGSELAVADNNGQLIFISMATLEPIRTISDIDLHVDHLTYSTDGAEILIWNYLGSYVLLDTQSSSVLAEKVNASDMGKIISTTPTTRKWVEYNRSDNIAVYDTLTQELLLEVNDAKHWSMSYDGNLLLTRNSDLIVQIWDIESGEVTFQILPPGENVATDGLYGAGFTPDGLVWTNYPQYVLYEDSVTWHSPIQFWDMTTGDIVFEVEGSHYYRSVIFDPTRSYMLVWGLTTSRSNRCWIWELDSLEEHGCYAGGNEWAIFSPDGHMIVVNNGTGLNVTFREIGGRTQPLMTLETMPTVHTEFSSDGRFFLTEGIDLHLWAVLSD